MECHIYRQPFVLVRQIKNKTNKFAKTKQEGQDNYKAREDNSRLSTKLKTWQKDNLRRARQSDCLAKSFHTAVRQSVLSCPSHGISVGQSNCLVDFLNPSVRQFQGIVLQTST